MESKKGGVEVRMTLLIREPPQHCARESGSGQSRERRGKERRFSAHHDKETDDVVGPRWFAPRPAHIVARRLPGLFAQCAVQQRDAGGVERGEESIRKQSSMDRRREQQGIEVGDRCKDCGEHFGRPHFDVFVAVADVCK